MELAGRLDRFWAALIDYSGVVFFGIAAALLMPALRGSSLMIPAAGACVLILVAIIGVQLWLMTTRGQTIGKKVMGLRIVLVKDLSNGGFVTNVLLRAGVPALINMVPILGMIFTLADPLCIFREDRRCLHDHIAGTCVIKA